jgi:hypothetical protein
VRIPVVKLNTWYTESMSQQEFRSD